METVSLLLCPPKPSIWTCKPQTTCWICYFAKVLKVARNILSEGDQFSTSLPSNSTTSKNKSDETMQILIKDFWSLLGWYQCLNCWGHASLHRELACCLVFNWIWGKIFTKLMSHSECARSKLPKASPYAILYGLSFGRYDVYLRTSLWYVKYLQS